MMLGQSTSSTTSLYLGGTSTVLNAVENILFFTAPTDTTLAGTERMRIDNAGYVGIGTTTPSALLNVNGTGTLLNVTSGSTSALSVNSSGFVVIGAGRHLSTLGGTQGAYPNFVITQNSSFTNINYTSIGLINFDGTDNPRMSIFLDNKNKTSGIGTTYSSGGLDFIITTGGTERLRISGGVNAPSGRIGIGTTTPLSMLNVVGDVNITTNLSVGGNFFANGSSVGIGTMSPNYPFKIGTQFFVETDGDTVIGSTGSAGAALDVGPTDSVNKEALRVAAAASSNVDIATFYVGTAWYIPQWASGSTLNNSVIYQNGSRIGIGTSSTIYMLTLQKSKGPDLAFVEPNTGLQSNASLGYASIGNITFSGSDTSINASGIYAAIESLVIDTNQDIQGSADEGGRIDFSIWRHDVGALQRAKYTALTIDNFARVGINTTTPTQLLDVNGNMNMSASGSLIYFGGSYVGKSGNNMIISD